MDLTFLGAATTVTGSQFLLETGQARILVDCGMFQGGPNEAIRNRVPRGYDPATLDAILLTHAHLDHCGLIPVIVREGFRGPIRATAGTIELARLVLMDSGRLQEEFAKRDARFERRQPGEGGERGRPRPPPLRGGDRGGRGRRGRRRRGRAARPARRAWRPTSTSRSTPRTTRSPPCATSGRSATTSRRRWRPGSTPRTSTRATSWARRSSGSAWPTSRAARSGSSSSRATSGKRNTPIIRDPTRVTDADYVLCESTYGGREHEPEAEARRVLAEIVRLVAEHDGVLLVPSFAIGRTQELDLGARPARLGRRDPGPAALPRLADGPRGDLDLPAPRRVLRRARRGSSSRPATRPSTTRASAIVEDMEESRAIARAPRPYMIVASNGMLTGGRVVGHLRELIDDPRAVILFVGYQGEGTHGPPPPGRGDDGAPRRRDPPGSLPDPLDERLLRPRRRARAARLAGRVRAAGKRRRRARASRGGSSSSTATRVRRRSWPRR